MSFTSSSVITLVVALAGAAASRGGDTLEVEAIGPRPLEQVVWQLQALSGVPITYEDVLCAHESGRTTFRWKGRNLTLCRFEPLNVEYPMPVQHDVESARAGLAAIRAAHATSGNPGSYGVFESGGRLHLRPLTMLDASGRQVAAESGLDVTVTTRRQRGALGILLDDLKTQVRETNHDWLGIVCANEIHDAEVLLRRGEAPLREVVEQLLSQVDHQTTWRLLTSPYLGPSGWMLRIEVVPPPQAADYRLSVARHGMSFVEPE